MTIKASDKLPYDDWFDENPLKGTKYIEEAVYESCDISIHQQMYDFCTRMIGKIGGSEHRY
tara:strand:+ start:303 stop:485 length:183 start_codon:yes stop_codon:yes gene_type:complete